MKHQIPGITPFQVACCRVERRFSNSSKSILSVLLLLIPIKTLPWGAVQGYAETHQFILRTARFLAGQDSYFRLKPFPSGDQLAANDYVIPGVFSKTGTGPDADGATPYSWHYYNPLLNQGMAPQKVADYYAEMLQLRAGNMDYSKSAAWTAHFLADMFVPYHVVGMYADRAKNWRVEGNGFVSESVSGPLYLYSYTAPPPVGWGGNRNFSNALSLFFNDYPVGNSAGVDWFDPWYFNGYGGTSSIGVITGSHAWWEYDIWRNCNTKILEDKLKLVMEESFFDPLWKNQKPVPGVPIWEEQARTAGNFAAACAKRTRENIEKFYRDPPLGIAMAVKAVYTLFRSSISMMELSWRQETNPAGGYRIVCQVMNSSMTEALNEVDLTLYHEINGRWIAANPIRLPGAVPPKGISEAYWEVSKGESKHCVVEASGIYRQTPDLGFTSISFTTVPSVKREERNEMIDPKGSSAISLWRDFPSRQGENGLFALAFQQKRRPDAYRSLNQSGAGKFDTPEQSGPAGRNNLGWNIPHVKRAGSNLQNGFIQFHPSARAQMGHRFGAEDAVYAWKAQRACRVDIGGAFRLTDKNSNDGVYVYIKLNNHLVWSSDIGTGNDMAQEFRLRQVAINPGDMIIWGVSAKSNDYSDSVNLQGEIRFSGQ